MVFRGLCHVPQVLAFALETGESKLQKDFFQASENLRWRLFGVLVLPAAQSYGQFQRRFENTFANSMIKE